MTNYGPNEIFNKSFERSLYKLSENHKIVDIGSMILLQLQYALRLMGHVAKYNEELTYLHNIIIKE